MLGVAESKSQEATTYPIDLHIIIPSTAENKNAWELKNVSNIPVSVMICQISFHFRLGLVHYI